MISKLRIQSDQVRAKPEEYYEVKTVGADTLWQAWVSRKHRELNMQLAQVMAEKMNAMDGVRTAFGRQTAVEKLAEQERKIQKLVKLGSRLTNF